MAVPPQSKPTTPKPPSTQKKPNTSVPPTRPVPWKRPVAGVVYGPPGVGKTSLMARFPGAMVVHDPNETGIVDLTEYGQVPKPLEMRQIDSFMELVALGDDAYEFKRNGVLNLVVDALSGFETLCFQHHCKVYFEDNWTARGFYSFQQGPKNAAKTDWPLLLDAFNNFLNAGISVWVAAHSRVKVYENPEGPNYDRIIPACDSAIWDQTHRWAKIVLFYNYLVTLDENQKTIKRKADQNYARIIQTEWSPTCDAKNRFGLSPVISCGDDSQDAYNNLASAFKALG